MKNDTKNKIIEILQKSNGEFVSGERLAKESGVSRSAVWKVINLLKKDGYLVEGVTNKGYRLQNAGGVLCQHAITRLLSQTPLKKVEVVKEISSTSKRLKEMAESGCESDYLLIANMQTDGVGRYGRKFYSPKESGIYFSLLLRPDKDVKVLTNVTVAMAVAVAQATEEIVGESCQIKWVNDILMSDKKVCGILTEGSINIETLSMNFLIVGVGINLYSPDGGFAEEIKHIAGSITKDKQIDKNLYLSQIIKNFYALFDNLEGESLYESYRRRLAFVGCEVDILKNGEKVNSGVILGVERDYNLIVRLFDGNIQKLDSGEISVKVAR